ncbi:MAG: response regulator transcription factor [Chloroflexi bacterium]|nr:response regulator transcription factor [Chloroflexota bacterium]
MMGTVDVLVAVAEPLLADGIASAIAVTDDLRVVAVPGHQLEITKQLAEFRPHIAIVDPNLFEPHPAQGIWQIKLAHPSIAMLVLVTRATSSCLARCLEAGIEGYLPKTVNARRLLEAIRGICNGEAVVDLQCIRQAARHLHDVAGEQDYVPEKSQLGHRELEVLKLAGEGLTNKEIAKRLFVSERTVQSHFSAIFDKLRARSRTEAVVLALRDGLIADDSLS